MAVATVVVLLGAVAGALAIGSEPATRRGEAPVVAGAGAGGRSARVQARTVRRRTATSVTTSTTVVPVPPPAPPTTASPVAPLAPDVASVAGVQRRLADLHYDPGPADGQAGQKTTLALQAFQKVHGLSPSGVIDAAVTTALADPGAPGPLVPDGGGDRVEIDLVRQLLFLYDAGSLRLITHVSTGSGDRYCVDGSCAIATTPAGSYRFSWRYPGWRTSRLGQLYNPVYFNGGIAVHGATSVPLQPASHGCVRIPMHIAEYFPSLVDSGDPVYVVDGRTEVGAASAPPPTTPPPPPDPPTPPPTTVPPPPPVPTTTPPSPPPPVPTTTPPSPPPPPPVPAPPPPTTTTTIVAPSQP